MSDYSAAIGRFFKAFAQPTGGDMLKIRKGEQQLASQAQSDRLAREQWAMQQKRYAQQTKGAKAGAKGLQALIGSYNRAFGTARTANEKRYQEMLGITDRTTGQQAADIRSEGVGEQANIMQRLARQGMAGSTVGATMRKGVRRDTRAELRRSADALQGRRLGIMERRTDAYPQSGMITNLATLLGQSGGGVNTGSMLKALGNMRLG